MVLPHRAARRTSCVGFLETPRKPRSNVPPTRATAEVRDLYNDRVVNEQIAGRNQSFCTLHAKWNPIAEK